MDGLFDALILVPTKLILLRLHAHAEMRNLRIAGSGRLPYCWLRMKVINNLHSHEFPEPDTGKLSINSTCF